MCLKISVLHSGTGGASYRCPWLFLPKDSDGREEEVDRLLCRFEERFRHCLMFTQAIPVSLAGRCYSLLIDNSASAREYFWRLTNDVKLSLLVASSSTYRTAVMESGAQVVIITPWPSITFKMASCTPELQNLYFEFSEIRKCWGKAAVYWSYMASLWWGSGCDAYSPAQNGRQRHDLLANVHC